MANELLRKQQQLLVVAMEATYGVDPTPTGAKAVLAQDMTVTLLENSTQGRNNITGSMGAQGQITVSRQAKSAFGVELATSGVATTPPAWGELLRGCGMAEVIDASSVAYTFIGSAFESNGFYFRLKKLQQKLLGTRGSFTLNLDKGTIPSIKFNMMSLYQDPTVEASDMAGVDTSAYKKPVGVTIDSVAVCTLLGGAVGMSKLSIDPGISVKFVNDVDQESMEVEARNGKLSITYRVDEQGMVDATAAASNNTEGAFAFQLGSVVGEKLNIDIPNIQVTKATPTWEGEFLYCQMEADIKPLTPNTDFTIIQS